MLLKLDNSKTLWRSAMVSLLVFFTVTLIARTAPSNWQDLLDGVRGAMLGVTLGLMALTVVAQRRRRR